MSPAPAEIRLPVTLYPSRFMSRLAVALFLIFAIVLAMVLRNAPWWLQSLSVLSTLFAIAFASDLLPQGAFLQLTKDGFSFRRFFVRRQVYRWKDVERFDVDWVDESPAVTFRLSPSYRERHGMRTVTANDSAAVRLLADNYGMKPKELAALMNALRQRYG